MAEKSGGAGDFEISRVVSHTFQAIGSNPMLYLAVALVLSGGPGFAMRWMESERGGPGNYPLLLLAKVQALGLPFLLIFVLNIFASAILLGALTRATLLSLAGKRPDFDRCLEPAIGMDEAHQPGRSGNRRTGHVHASTSFRRGRIHFPTYTVGNGEVLPDLPFILDETVVLLQSMSFIPQGHHVSGYEWEKGVVADIAEEILRQP